MSAVVQYRITEAAKRTGGVVGGHNIDSVVDLIVRQREMVLELHGSFPEDQGVPARGSVTARAPRSLSQRWLFNEIAHSPIAGTAAIGPLRLHRGLCAVAC